MMKGRKEKPGGKGKTNRQKSNRDPTDCYHNLSTPCCQIARDVIVQIFPEFASGKQSPSDDETGPDLLAKIIREYVLEERRKCQEVPPSPCKPLEGGAGKKKKKKKKKKASQQQFSPATILAAKTDSDGASSQRLLGPSEEKKAISMDAASPSAVSHVPLQTSPNSLRSEMGPTQPSSFNFFLDQLLKSGADASHSLPNRDLGSFVSFLWERYEERQRQTTRGGKKKRGGEEIQQISDVVPVIKLADAYTCCDDACCHMCKRSASAYLRSVLEGTGRSSNTACSTVDHGDNCLFVIDSACAKVPDRKTPANLLQHLDSTSDGVEVETFFDYVALEEGLVDVKCDSDSVGRSDGDSNRFRLELGTSTSTSPDDMHLQLRNSCPKESEGQYAMSAHDIKNMVVYVLVPGALEELEYISSANIIADTNENGEFLSDEEFANLQITIKDQIHRTARMLAELNVFRGEIQSLHDEAFEARIQDNFAPKASHALRSCDQVCDKYLHCTTSLMRTTTSLTVDVSSEDSAAGEWARTLLQGLWDAYNNSLRSLIEPSMNYKARVVQINQRPGSVPAMYFSATQRREFEIFLEAKISAIYALHERIEQLLLTSTASDGTKSLLTGLQQLCALSAYYSSEREDSFLPGPLHDMIEDILLERQQLACASIHSVSAKEMLGVQKQRCDTFRAELNHFDRLYREEDATLDVDDFPRTMNDLLLKKKTQEDELYRGAYSRGEGVEGPASSGDLKVEVQHLFDASGIAILEWRLLVMRQHHKWACCERNRPPRLKHLPHRLVQWLTDSDDDKKNQPDECDGAGARRRVSCILAALLYRWLQSRCLEWHADLTQKELLAAMETDDLLSGSGNPEKVKSSKKKKKKAKKKTGAAKDDGGLSSHDNTLDVALQMLSNTAIVKPSDRDAVNGENNLEKVQKGTTHDQDTLVSTPRETQLELDPPVVCDDSAASVSKSEECASRDGTEASKSCFNTLGTEVETGLSKTTSSAVGRLSPSHIMLPADHSATEDSFPSDDFGSLEVPVCVGLVDGSKFLPAESYLVNRLEAVMKTSERTHTPAGENIIFL